jgi:hypothetical protein
MTHASSALPKLQAFVWLEARLFAAPIQQIDMPKAPMASLGLVAALGIHDMPR